MSEVSRFGVVEPADLPDDLRERVGAIAEKSGFVPNIFRALGRRPRELRAFLDYHDALMDSNDGLSKAERELVVVATSGANHCTYCVVAHGAILRVRSKDPELADHVGTNPYGAELSGRHRAIVDLALALALDSASFTDDDVDAAREAGLTEDEILGRRVHHGPVRHVQPSRAPDRAAAQCGVLHDGPLSPRGTRGP